jgi:CRISPR-associated protein Cmr6
MTIDLGDWWRVARGAGAVMRGWEAEDAPSRLPAHVGLWLDRMLAEPYKQGRQEWTGRQQLYRTAEKALAPGAASDQAPPAVESYRPLFAAWREALEEQEPGVERHFLTFEATSRILLHPASNSTVTDGSILLHHTYGVPYLPGSAIKGVVRSRLERMSRGEEAQRFGDLAGEMLGVLGLASLIDFLDALWIPEGPGGKSPGWSPLALDIVNPHHPSYYTAGEGGRRPPSDMDDPVPVHRLSLAPRTRFLVVAETPRSPEIAPWLKWLLEEVLVRALAEDGIGAWTSAGYGRLKRVETGKVARPEAVPPVSDWQPALVIYQAGPGELTAVLRDGRRARAGREQSRAMLASIPESLRTALTVRSKREATAEVQVSREGAAWRLIALRRAGDVR